MRTLTDNKTTIDHFGQSVCELQADHLWTDCKATASKWFAIAKFHALQTHLHKVEVQFYEQSLMPKLPAIAPPETMLEVMLKTNKKY